MSDLDRFKALLDSAGLMCEESRTGASEGGLRTYLTIPSGPSSIIAQFSGHGKLVGFEALWTEAPGEEEPHAIPMILNCPGILENGNVCGARHIDRGEFATKLHATHSCQRCGFTWKPAKVDTIGVEFLPGYKNDSV